MGGGGGGGWSYRDKFAIVLCYMFLKTLCVFIGPLPYVPVCIALLVRLLVCGQASVSSSGKTTTSSMEELDLPSPPANLSRNQQQEYMQLKRKLALHEKKRLRDPKSLGGTSTGMKITKGVASKPPLPVSRPSPSHSGCSTPPLPVSRPSPSHSGCSTPPLTTSHSPEVMDNALLAKSAEKEAEERNALVLECQRKISGTAEKLKGTRAHEEEEQQQITSLTNQLTECVSEIVEHEQVMVRVQQQLALLRREQEVRGVWNAGARFNYVRWNLCKC